MSEISLAVIQKLAEERRQREGRERSWEMVIDTLSHLGEADIVVESNPLDLGAGGMSYLEQVQILLPEVSPGHGEIMQKALVLLLDLLRHRARDMLTDEERVAIGWDDV